MKSLPNPFSADRSNQKLRDVVVIEKGLFSVTRLLLLQSSFQIQRNCVEL